QFDQVCKWRRIFIRMCPVRIEEASTVCAKILDYLQCGYGALRYHLPCALDSGGVHIGVKVHRNTLPDEQQSTHQCARQEYPEQCARRVDPKVAERAGELSRKTANKRDTNR